MRRELGVTFLSPFFVGGGGLSSQYNPTVYIGCRPFRLIDTLREVALATQEKRMV